MNALSAIGAREHIRAVLAGSIQDLVLIFPGALGDLLLVLPTLRRLRRRHRPARTVLVVGEPQRALAHMFDVADVVASLDDADAAWLFGGSTVPRWLAPGSTVFSWLGTRAPLGERLRRLAANAHVLSVERGPGRAHAAVAYALAAGVPADRRRLAAEAAIAPPGSVRAAALVEGLRRPLLAVHRGAGAPAKRWALDGFVDVASWWRRSRGDVIELLGPAEAGEPPLSGARTAAGWALPDVAALLGLADAYVGNDSGVSHLAGAVGTPGVVLFRVTAPSRWRPLSPRLVVLRGDVKSGEVGRALAQLSAGSVACERSGSAS
jgi:heptosyltransferase III